ncbi:MAG: hypothetical protein DWQ01_09215 [Planctomycetota bacterium]|nr:MAG: hypothetical protein DWQ01_09215 [Planctomycetota bacterium]
MCACLFALSLLLLGPQGSSWQGGYLEDVAGEIIPYDSALPEVDTALLVRSRRAEDFIEWRTQPLQMIEGTDHIDLVWLFGMDANPRQHRFTLHGNGKPWLVFENPGIAEFGHWRVDGDFGIHLDFHVTRIDRHEDVFGFAVLRVPVSKIMPGESLHLKVEGESAGSSIWYMTFRAHPMERIRLTSRPALLKQDGEAWQPILADIVHLGDPVSVRIHPSWGRKQMIDLKLGANQVILLHPKVDRAVRQEVSFQFSDGRKQAVPLTVPPVRPWMVYLVQHTHTDLGYTRPQTEILPDHLRYIDYALDYCDWTDSYPEDAKFRWTCEASWPVQEWLRFRPQSQIDRLRRRIKEGRIELTAMFANLSELLGERACAASLQPLQEFRRHDLPVSVAMQDDVNGIAWNYIDYFQDLGVDVLNMGQHGHRALIPFDHPTAFWWQAPSGSRILAWRPDHYNTGNFWGLHTARFQTIEPALFGYLQGLEAKNYPLDEVAVQYSGVFLDNAPPGIAANDFIRHWNERYIWPRLRSAVVSELPRRIAEESGAELAIFQAAWPDWWSDGLGSAPREAAAARRCQNELAAVEHLVTMASLRGLSVPNAIADEFRNAWQQLVFYGEHTYGAAESVRDPSAENSQIQWAQKSAFVWEAVKQTAMLKEKAFGLLQPALLRSVKPTIAVVNPDLVSRSGLARVFVDRTILSREQDFRIIDSEGVQIPAQLWKAQHDGNWWAISVRDVPAFGWRSYLLEVEDQMEKVSDIENSEMAAQVEGILENRYYRLQIDLNRGGLISLLDKELGREFVDEQASWGFGQLVHEQLGNRWQLERFRLDDVRRTGLKADRWVRGPTGPLWRSLTLYGTGAVCEQGSEFSLEIRLYEQEKKLEFRYRLRKRPELAPEGLYAAFPFALPDFELKYETAGGPVDPETDMLPRASSDWQAVQRFIQLDSPHGGVDLSSEEILLYQFGDFQLGRFSERPQVERPYIFAWLFNNYWVTNFLGSQSGELVWTQAITTGRDSEMSSSTRFGWHYQTPFLTRVRPAGKVSNGQADAVSLLSLEGGEFQLIGSTHLQDGKILLQLREIAGRASKLKIFSGDGKALKIAKADPLGRVTSSFNAEIQTRAKATTFVVLNRDSWR